MTSASLPVCVTNSDLQHRGPLQLPRLQLHQARQESLKHPERTADREGDAADPKCAEKECAEKNWSQWPDSNRRPTVYETVALPLSYIGSRTPGHPRRGDAPSRPATPNLSDTPGRGKLPQGVLPPLPILASLTHPGVVCLRLPPWPTGTPAAHPFTVGRIASAHGQAGSAPPARPRGPAGTRNASRTLCMAGPPAGLLPGSEKTLFAGWHEAAAGL